MKDFGLYTSLYESLSREKADFEQKLKALGSKKPNYVIGWPLNGLLVKMNSGKIVVSTGGDTDLQPYGVADLMCQLITDSGGYKAAPMRVDAFYELRISVLEARLPWVDEIRMPALHRKIMEEIHSYQVALADIANGTKNYDGLFACAIPDRAELVVFHKGKFKVDAGLDLHFFDQELAEIICQNVICPHGGPPVPMTEKAYYLLRIGQIQESMEEIESY